jgi:hypothetical protein
MITEFNYEIPRPKSPKKPERLLAYERMSITTMSDIELDSYKELRGAYDHEIVEFKEELANWQRGYGEARRNFTDNFWDCLYKQHNVAPENPIVEWVKSQAYEQGHSAGYSEVANCFGDLIEVLSIVEEHYVAN